MIIRCMAYELEEYERQIRELQKEHQMRGDLIAEEYLSGIKKEDKIIPVAVLLIYFGEEAWDGASYKRKIKFVGYTEIYKSRSI